MMYGLYNDFCGGFGGGFMMLLFWIFVISIIVWIVREISNKSSKSGSSSNALEILKERYAKGEIDRKEFEDKKKDIS